mgnify:CR=1 FL=1
MWIQGKLSTAHCPFSLTLAVSQGYSEPLDVFCKILEAMLQLDSRDAMSRTRAIATLKALFLESPHGAGDGPPSISTMVWGDPAAFFQRFNETVMPKLLEVAIFESGQDQENAEQTLFSLFEHGAKRIYWLGSHLRLTPGVCSLP